MFSLQNDEIDEDPVVGNVTSSSNGPDHLIFDANFECGNLGRVDALTPNEYDLFIRPDTCNPKYRVWFYFSVSNAKLNQHIELCVCMDIHAHSRQTNAFLYGNLTTKDPKICEQQLYIPYLLAELTEDYSLHFTQFNTDAEKAGTNRRAMGALLDSSCLCYTLEVSFFSYKPKDSSTAKSIPYFDYTYELLGEKLAQSILHYQEALNGERNIAVKRSFESFLPKRCVKSYKQLGKAIKAMDLRRS